MLQANVSNFLSRLSKDKLLALVKSQPPDCASELVDLVLQRIYREGWVELLNRLSSRALCATCKEIGLLDLEELDQEDSDGQCWMVNAIISHAENKSPNSVLSKFSPRLLAEYWTELGIQSVPQIRILEIEHLIGGLESVFNLWTIAHLKDIASMLSILPIDCRSVKKSLIFRIIKFILCENSARAEVVPLGRASPSRYQTRTSQLVDPAQASVSNQFPVYIHQGKKKALKEMASVDKEN